jgi:hypothetical protein
MTKTMSSPDAREMAARQLLEAIERLRLDMVRVELWALAMHEFAQPVRDYDPAKTNVWVPFEQASTLQSSKASEPADH